MIATSSARDRSGHRSGSVRPRGRRFASNTRPVAPGTSGRAASPYTVSVGKTTRPPPSRACSAAATAPRDGPAERSNTSIGPSLLGGEAAPDHPVAPGQVRQNVDRLEARRQDVAHLLGLLVADLHDQPAAGPEPSRRSPGQAAV